jgi:hypothetical protein
MPNSRVSGSNITNITDITDITDIATTDSASTDSAKTVTIDCDCCTLRNTSACDDCVVSFLLEREPEDAVVIDADEARAMRMLERAGLVPTLRFSSRAG